MAHFLGDNEILTLVHLHVDGVKVDVTLSVIIYSSFFVYRIFCSFEKSYPICLLGEERVPNGYSSQNELPRKAQFERPKSGYY